MEDWIDEVSDELGISVLDCSGLEVEDRQGIFECECYQHSMVRSCINPDINCGELDGEAKRCFFDSYFMSDDEHNHNRGLYREKLT